MSIVYLSVWVVHGEVWDNDGDGEGDHQDPAHGTQGTNKHAQIGLGHHAPVAHRRHRHQGPPQAQRDRAEVVARVHLNIHMYSTTIRPQ